MAVDSGGNVFAAGFTYSVDFPTSERAWQRVYAGGVLAAQNDFGPHEGGDAFLARIAANGRRIEFSTYLGGSGNDFARLIQVDAAGNVFIAGGSSSADFPTTPGAYLEGGPRTSFVAKFDARLERPLYATLYEHEIQAMDHDSTGNLFLAGTVFGNAHVSQLNRSGAAITSSRVLEGSAPAGVNDIRADSRGHVWIAGNTWSESLRTRNALQDKLAPSGCRSLTRGPYTLANCGDALIAKLGAGGEWEFVTYWGGKESETGLRLHVDESGNAHVIGAGLSPDFPTTANALLRSNCGDYTLWLSSFDPTGRLLRSTYLPPCASYLHHDARAVVVLSEAGELTIVDLNARPVAAGCLVNAASQRFSGVGAVRGSIAPGEIITVYGSSLGPREGVEARPDAGGRFPTLLAQTRLVVNGTPAPLLYVHDQQINAVVPFASAIAAEARIEVEHQGRRSVALLVPVTPAAPGIFTLDGTGTGPAAIVNEDGSVNSPWNPASKRSVVSIYATGIGLLEPPTEDGRVVSGILRLATLPLRVRFGGPADGEILFAGAAPGFVAGLIQINVRIPEEAASGEAVDVGLRAGEQESSSRATVAIR